VKPVDRSQRVVKDLMIGLVLLIPQSIVLIRAKPVDRSHFTQERKEGERRRRKKEE
jgi:hypothetical protein